LPVEGNDSGRKAENRRQVTGNTEHGYFFPGYFPEVRNIGINCWRRRENAKDGGFKMLFCGWKYFAAPDVFSRQV
jgi:hypothetical protein